MCIGTNAWLVASEEQISGRAFGELDPKLPANAIIQDIELAKDADGKVRYVASFVIYKPVDLGQASGLMWHDVPNRGRVFPFASAERALGDIMLASAWQGDNSGATTVRPTASAAIVGAALLGLDQIDADPDAQARLRGELGTAFSQLEGVASIG